MRRAFFISFFPKYSNQQKIVPRVSAAPLG
jgi:hypothetical protein